MKKISILLFIVAACWQWQAQGQDLFSAKYPVNQLKKILTARSQWVPFPKITDRAAWSAADQAMMKSFYDKALTYVDYAWPSIPATTSLLIERTGDRATYDAM